MRTSRNRPFGRAKKVTARGFLAPIYSTKSSIFVGFFLLFTKMKKLLLAAMMVATTLAAMAQTKTKRIEDRNRTSNNNVESYKQNAKPGSLASKANMVSDFNKKNK